MLAALERLSLFASVARQFFLLRCFLESVFFLVFAEFVLSDDQARCDGFHRCKSRQRSKLDVPLVDFLRFTRLIEILEVGFKFALHGCFGELLE